LKAIEHFISPQQFRRLPNSPHFIKITQLFKKIIATLEGAKWRLLVLAIHFSNDAERLFWCSLAIYISSWSKACSNPLLLFSLGYLFLLLLSSS
jgi:hypothetical protein